MEVQDPWETREKGKDKQFDAYWRLDCPTSGTTVEAFWPGFSCWLPAKFLRVNADGSFCVSWKSDNSTSTLPTDHVRKVGDLSVPDPKLEGLGSRGRSGPLMRLLRKARTKWSDRDVYAAADKLKSIDICEVEDLVAAVEAELRGEAEGVNQRLQRGGHRSFAEPTLRALRRAFLAEAKEKAEEESTENQPERQRPLRPSGAFSRQVLQPQQVFSYEEPLSEVKEPEQLPGTSGLKSGFLLEPGAEREERQEPPSSARFTWKAARPKPEPAIAPEPEPAPAMAPVEPPARPEPEAEVVFCPRRHPLRLEGAPYDMDCDRCGREMGSGENIWWCGLCGYDLCEDCHAEKALE